MPDGKLHLKIFTSESTKYDGAADMVIMRSIYDEGGAAGDIGILPGHTPLSAVLGKNIMRIINEGQEQQLNVHGGIVNVHDNVVTVMTEKALRPEDEVSL